jgi:hypothetical protein
LAVSFRFFRSRRSGQAIEGDFFANCGARAFLIAGAATRWKVPDEPATTRFLLDFYRVYRQGGPGGKGLRKIRRSP